MLKGQFRIILPRFSLFSKHHTFGYIDGQKRYLLNNEQIVQKVAESKPIKRAAQLTVSMGHKAKALGLDNVQDVQKNIKVFKEGFDAASKKKR